MVDTLDKATRSWVMSRIRGTDTKPERRVRSLLHRQGFRFTVRGPKNRKLPGKPDIVLPKHNTIIFVHGCFWHGHPNCRHFRIPKTRTAWWRAKIDGNRTRDQANQARLEALGWRVLVIWTCAFDTLEKERRFATQLPHLILTESPQLPLTAEDPKPYRASAVQRRARR